jgi:hypothetical protein
MEQVKVQILLQHLFNALIGFISYIIQVNYKIFQLFFS